jgi:hypothetical protein
MLPLDARLLVLCSLQRSASALVPNSSPGFELSHPNVVELNAPFYPSRFSSSTYLQAMKKQK